MVNVYSFSMLLACSIVIILVGKWKQGFEKDIARIIASIMLNAVTGSFDSSLDDAPCLDKIFCQSETVSMNWKFPVVEHSFFGITDAVIVSYWSILLDLTRSLDRIQADMQTGLFWS